MTTPALELRMDGDGRLTLTGADGADGPAEAVPVRAFPLSDPERWISLCDSAGREVACVEDPATLSPTSRQALSAALAAREFLPVLTEVVRISGYAEPSEWEVRTDRGPTTFLLRSPEDIRKLGPDRFLIVDARGVRYLLPAASALDSASRRRIRRFL